MRIYLSFNIFRFSYPFGTDDNDIKWINGFIKRTLEDKPFGRVIIFETLEQEEEFKKSAILDHNILRIEDLFY